MKHILSIGFLVLLLGLAPGLACNNDFARPSVELTDLQFEGISLDGIDVILLLEVDNPNPFGVTVNRIAFDIEFERQGEWVFLGRADRDTEVHIEANEVTEVDIPTRVGTTEAVEAVFELLGPGGGNLTLRADGDAWVDVQVTEVRVPFQETHPVEIDFPDDILQRFTGIFAAQQ